MRTVPRCVVLPLRAVRLSCALLALRELGYAVPVLGLLPAGTPLAPRVFLGMGDKHGALLGLPPRSPRDGASERQAGNIGERVAW